MDVGLAGPQDATLYERLGFTSSPLLLQTTAPALVDERPAAPRT